MKNFIFILLFSFISLFAQVQNQQQRADNGKPYTVAIHRLNNKTLNDSLLMEVEDTTNYFSRRTSVGQLKNYIANRKLFYSFTLNSDSTITVTDSTTYRLTDEDGDTITLQMSFNRGINPIIYGGLYKKGTGTLCSLSTTGYVSVGGAIHPATVQVDNLDINLYSYSILSADNAIVVSQNGNLGNPTETGNQFYIMIDL